MSQFKIRRIGIRIRRIRSRGNWSCICGRLLKRKVLMYWLSMYVYVERFGVRSQLFLLLNSVFVRSRPDMVPQVKYFRKFSTDSNKQGLKWKRITSPSYIEKKSKFLNFHKKMYLFDVNFFLFLFSVSIHVQFQQMMSQMKFYDTHYLF